MSFFEVPAGLEGAFAQFCCDRPAISVGQACEIARSVYGMAVSAAALPGERDANFVLRDAHGRRTVLKIMNADETAEDAAFVSEVMDRLAGQVAEIGLAGIVPTLAGETIAVLTVPGAEGLMARMVEWVEGVPMGACAGSARLAHGTGRAVGLMARALQGMAPPMRERVLLWDSLRVDALGGLLRHVPQVERRRATAGFLDRFRDAVRPLVDGLPRQPIHNDLNGSNLLVAADDAGRVAGIVDFGDAVFAPRINDLAVAASYQLGAGPDPLAGVGAMLAGFATVVVPDAAEVDLLFDLVVARLVLRGLLTEWRSVLFPDNRDYIRRNSVQAGLALDWALALPPGRGRAAIREAWAGR
ncbi:phosphotransferase [Gluconacetobacter sp. Hr-1-5]|uniref:phosphotransferase n=1 Tax=Gluconacetobacter sp. Hr-1-5 TaxID=3395370 RepID=UPI003B5202D1